MKPTTSTFGSKLTTLIEPETTPTLRSAVGYTEDAYTIHFLRDDVGEQYSETDIRNAIDELRLTTLTTSHTNSVFKTIHGELSCHVNVFADAVEYHFVIADGVGVELAFDRGWLTTAGSVIDDVSALLAETTAYSPTSA